MENKIFGADEIYLAPEQEKIINADEISEISLWAEKCQFIIKYAAEEKENLTAEIEKIGGEIVKDLEFADVLCVKLSMAQLKALKSTNMVETVEKDYDYKLLTSNVSENNFVEYLAGAKSELFENTIKLAVFDTGCSDTSKVSTIYKADFVNEADENSDINGHGTQMVEIIAECISNLADTDFKPVICSVTVADNNGFVKTSTIMQALDWAINNNIKIINMSFGDYHKSSLLENMINRAANCGIILVAAAGNDGGFADETRIMYPAAFDNVLSVGAKSGNTVASYSNGGETVDILACATFGGKSDANILYGTSASAAFVSGEILKDWCKNSLFDKNKIIDDIKFKFALISNDKGSDEASAVLTENTENGIMTLKKNSPMGASEIAAAASINSDNGIGLLCVDDDCYSSNDMSSAINIPFINWQSGYISCPGNEVWYKFTANASGVHPNGSPGWYTIHTQGNLDTVGYLYDSYGHQIAYNDDGDNGLNFNIWAQLDYYETYYIRVKAYGGNTGSYKIRVSYFSDDHGNTPDTATIVTGVYYEDKSVSGCLHSQDDVDYYTFVPARNCVMEIYTEGDTNTYGQLYCASGGLLDSDSNGNGNGNFKITAHLESMKRYYIAVSHQNSTGYGDYTLRFKFVKDYCDQLVDEQYRVMFWYADNQDEYPEMGNWITRSKVFVSNRAKAEFEDRIILDEYNQKTGLRAVLDNGTFQDIFNYLLDYLISSIPLIGSSLSFAFNVGSIMYNFMSSSDLTSYREKKHAIENTNQYIIGEHAWFTDYPNGMATGSYNTYSIGSGTYYGKEYQRGTFIETYIKS